MIALLKNKYNIQLLDVIKIYYCLLVCMDIPYVEHLFPIRAIIKAIFYLVGLILGVMFVYERKKINKSMLWITLLYAIIFFSTQFHYGLRIGLSRCLPMVIAYMICMVIAACNEEQRMDVIKTWKIYLLILLSLDCATYLLKPNGLFETDNYENNWFLGYKTERLCYTLPLMMLWSYMDVKKYGTILWKTFIIGVVAIIMGILSDGTVASAVMMLYLMGLVATKLCFMIPKQEQKENVPIWLYRILDYRVIIVIYTLIFISVVVIQEGSIVKQLVAELFGKSLTFTGRTKIWKFTIEEFLKEPIWGQGLMGIEEYVALTSNRYATNAHNYILSILVSGGVIAFIQYMILHITTFRRSDKTYQMEDMIWVCAIYVSLILGFVSSTFLFAPFMYIPYILMQKSTWSLEELKGKKWLKK